MRRGAPCRATRHATEARRWPQTGHTDSCQAATAAGCRKPGQRAQHAKNHGTRTGASKHQPLSGWMCARPAANPAPAGYRTAAVRNNVCAAGGYPAPGGYKKRLSSEAPPTKRRTHNTWHKTRSKHTGEHEPSGQRTPRKQHHRLSGHSRALQPRCPGHRTHNTTHRLCTPLNRSQVAEDT